MTTRPTTVGDRVLTPVESIITLTRDLITIPSRAGQDRCEPIIEHAVGWLATRGVSVSVLSADDGAPVAVVAEVSGAMPGPTYCLNACLDTAPFGSLY